MALNLGSTSIGSLYLGSAKIGSAYVGGTKVYESSPALPAYTIRLKYTDGVTPTFSKGTGVQVSSSPNVWDLTYENTSWSMLLYNHSDLIEVIGANTTNVTIMDRVFLGCTSLTSVPLFDTANVTDMNRMFMNCSTISTVPLFNTSNVTNISSMFYGCTSLTTVPLFNTSNVTNTSSMFTSCTSLTSVPLFNTGNVTNASHMFSGCSALTAIPLFDTSKMTNMSSMFWRCGNVGSGALDIYTQAARQTTPPVTYNNAFDLCGAYTTTGAIELSQIPSSWGGNAQFVQQEPAGITMLSGTQWPTNVESVTELQVSATVNTDASMSAVYVAIAPNSTDYSSSSRPLDAVSFRLSSVSADDKTGVWNYTLSATERSNVAAGTHRIWVWRDLGANVVFNLVSADCGYYGVAVS